MCSINVCGLNSELRYNILQSYIETFDIVYRNYRFQVIFDDQKNKRHKYGGIHGITIFIKEFIAQREVHNYS